MVVATVSRSATDLVAGDHAEQQSDAAVHPVWQVQLPMLDSTRQLCCEQVTQE